MKQTFDTDDILYGVLKASTTLTSSISGGVYTMGERPDGSEKEDIVVSTITLTQDTLPQRGTSNVNIHIADIDVKIAGKLQKKSNRTRLQAITILVLATLTAANIAGLKYWVTIQTTIAEPATSQHFVNLRIEWNIH